MRKLVEYPTPSLAERDRRWAAVRKEMDARGLDGLILCGWPAMWDFNIANARYLCPIGGNAEFNVLVFPRAGEPTSFIYSPVFTDYWRGAQSWVSDVRPKRGTFGDSVADRLTELGLAGAAVGIDGLAGPLDPDGWVPHSMYARLRERLPKLSLVNLDDMMEKLRTVKSAEEIAILEKAAALGDLMLQACRDTARPGVKECEVYARMMEVMLANGGEEPTLFLWAADAHPYPHPFRVPTTRPLAKGDMIICEMHPKFGGYFTHVERTFCLGEPEPRYLDIYDACLAAYRRGLELFKPRAKISQVMDAVRDSIEGKRLRHLRSRHPRARTGVARISALPPPRQGRGRRRAQGDRRRIPRRHGVRHEHRPVRSEMARRRDRLRLRRDHRHHRERRAPATLFPHRVSAGGGVGWNRRRGLRLRCSP
ncbi:MAG: aminopeptidase P family protein [Hyphomicrobiales bacterium]|nr:aminopeptidase P family protein [Hyphomicrobiales bacterium]